MDPDEIELRLREIYVPKTDWIFDVYGRIFDREPKSILDIGAGSGHLLYGCKRMGLDVAGDRIFQRPYTLVRGAL